MTAHEVANPHIWNDKDGAAVAHGRLSAKTSAGAQPGRGLFIAAPGQLDDADRWTGRRPHRLLSRILTMMEQSAASRRKVMTFQPTPSGCSPPAHRAYVADDHRHLIEAVRASTPRRAVRARTSPGQCHCGRPSSEQLRHSQDSPGRGAPTRLGTNSNSR